MGEGAITVRTEIKRMAAGAAVIAGCLAGAAGTASGANPPQQKAAPSTSSAPSAPSTSAAPSSLVLAVGQGGVTGTMVPSRTVRLECGAYAPGGDHPHAAEACDALTRTGGDLARLVGSRENPACGGKFGPVTVTADGYWKGRRVTFDHTFKNACVKRLNASPLFQF